MKYGAVELYLHILLSVHPQFLQLYLACLVFQPLLQATHYLK